MGHSRVSPYGTPRTVPRYIFVAVAAILEGTTQKCTTGSIKEISRNGCYVDTVSLFPVGTLLKVVISRDEGSFATNGKVIYARDERGMGVSFVDPPADQLKVLDNWRAKCNRTAH